ncbi:hypothetical protein PILCRDRAFT_5116 [Piloderma croceum F 1598]|uniref:Uncharacterized protein n=1 Tax=Piloderma croceum (strain F 1598) TaxID=765440 RepID=A0A0C3BIB0_PILCF|nr:hypothetical protein PILCRDRAFT_5116 [Piloderma croceum F 1598]
MGVSGSAGAGADAGYEYATAAGVAGIGAAGWAVAMQTARSRKDTNNTGISTPEVAGFGAGGGDYPSYEESTAFAGPGPQPHEMYDQGGSQEANFLEAAGAGAVGANRRPSEPTHRMDLARHKSQGSYGNVSEGPGAYSSSSSPPPPGELYAAHYQRGYNPDLAPQKFQQQGYTGRASGGFSQKL